MRPGPKVSCIIQLSTHSFTLQCCARNAEMNAVLFLQARAFNPAGKTQTHRALLQVRSPTPRTWGLKVGTDSAWQSSAKQQKRVKYVRALKDSGSLCVEEKERKEGRGGRENTVSVKCGRK